jgi:uncharacterized protein GlcG (DUF336 family)
LFRDGDHGLDRQAVAPQCDCILIGLHGLHAGRVRLAVSISSRRRIGAQNKARTSARFRRETRLFYNQFETGHAYVNTLDAGLVASPGGFPLVEGGKLVGAIGCSGGTGDQDASVCKAAADTIK